MRTQTLFVFLAACLYAQSPQPSPPHRIDQKSQPQRNTSEPKSVPQSPGNSAATSTGSVVQATAQNVEHGTNSKTESNINWSNWALVAVGIAGTAAALKTLSAIKEQARLTHQSLVLTHRPKLAVRNVFVHGGMGGLKEGTTADGNLSIVNKGGMVAHVTETFATAKVYGQLPMKTLHDDGISGNQETRRLDPGERMIIPFKKEDGALAGGEIPALHSGGTADQRRLYVLGFITYTDDLDPPIVRQTFFCRALNPGTGRFEPVKDSDFENAD